MVQDKFTFMQKIEFGLNIINHVFIGFVSIYLSYVCCRGSLKGTALHAWLCTIGYNLLMAEAVMCHYSGNFLTFSAKRKTKTTVHWVLQVLGGGLGIAGAIIKILDKKTHFTTIHGITGLTATILSGLSMISGLTALFNQEMRAYFRPLLNKGLHNFLGLGGFVLGMVAMYYGYSTGFFRRKVEPDFADMMRAFTIISLILSSIGPLKALYYKINSFAG